MRGRAYIKNMVMINWRGIPCEIIEYDRRLTALEGENGAGKTTAQTAAYLPLMPDLNQIKITNVGDTDDSGRKNNGLHGKLGASGACYSALEIYNPRSERCLVGVMLLPKVSQHVEIKKYFVIERIPEHLPLEKILLLERDGEQKIPSDASIICEQAVLFGAKDRPIKDLGDYGTALWELGILPLKLGDPKKRSQFNKILQTAFQGNFSNSLQQRIKDYLLPEGTNVGSQLSQMQEHMTMCRRTRNQVERLEQSTRLVYGLHQKALTLMDAAVATVRLQALESKQRAAEAKLALEEAKKERDSLQEQIQKMKEDLGILETQLQEKSEAADQAESARKDAESARTFVQEIARLEEEKEKVQGRFDLAHQEKERAEEELRLKRRQAHDLSAEYQQICGDLADAREHWRRISQEAGLYDQATKSLQEAQRSLPEQEVSESSAQNLLQESIEKEKKFGEEFRTLRQETESAQQARQQFEEAFKRVTELLGEQIAPEEAFYKAQKVEADHAEDGRRLKEAENLPPQLEKARGLEEKQNRLRQRLLEVNKKGFANSEALKGAHADLEEELSCLRAELATAKENVALLQRKWTDAKEEKQEIQGKIRAYDEIHQSRVAAEKRHQLSLSSEEALDELIRTLGEKRDKAIGEIELSKRRINDLRQEIESVFNNTEEGHSDLAQKLEGHRLASMFEDISAEEAPELQARLGPLVDAIVVSDVEAALQKIDAMKEPPEETWLLEKSRFKVKELRGQRMDKLVAVASELGVRATRIPQFPRLGHDSIRAYIEHLQQLRRDSEAKVRDLIAEKVELAEEIAQIQKLRDRFSSLAKGDPRSALKDCEKRLRDLEEKGAIEKQNEERLGALIGKEQNKLTVFTHCLPDSYLLDAEDYADVVRDLETRIEQMDQLRQRYLQRQPLVDRVHETIGALRFLPPSEGELEGKRERLKTLSTNLGFWSKARQAMEALVAHLDHFKFEESFNLLEKMEDNTQELKLRADLYKEKVDQANEAIGEAQDMFKQKEGVFTEVHSALEVTKREILLQKEKLEKLGVPGDEDFLKEATRKENEAKDALKKAQDLHRQETITHGGLKKDLEQKESAAKTAQTSYDSAFARWRPYGKLNQRIRHFLKIEPSLNGLDIYIEDFLSRFGTSQEAYSRTATAWGELRGEVKNQKKAEHLTEILFEMPPSLLSGQAPALEKAWSQYQDVWSQALAFITRTLPADIVISGNVGEAVNALHLKHKSLKTTLLEEEGRFKTSARSVARTIKTNVQDQVRKISKINLSLRQVRFGNVEGIHIACEWRSNLKRLLEIMESEEEWSLFTQLDKEKDEVALSEMMNRVYQKSTGGKSEGDMLLDYRNYVRMEVRIYRKGDQKPGPTTGMSTGEAMGTGAAILIVVLQAWEEQVTIREQALKKNLRFLFMDEASRMDYKSIKTLLEFCEVMDVQLLIAGPEFKARETGDGITYRLNRQFNDEGERVIIRGRRGFGGELVAGPGGVA